MEGELPHHLLDRQEVWYAKSPGHRYSDRGFSVFVREGCLLEVDGVAEGVASRFVNPLSHGRVRMDGGFDFFCGDF